MKDKAISRGKKKGLFITFEGPEGSGKSTHSRLLYDFLKDKGYRVLYVREPGGTGISESIRRILLNRANKNMTSRCELFLFLASRAQITEEMIIPALKKGYIVICDRFEDATIAYQGYGAGLDLRKVKLASRLATGGLKPDLTILLDVVPKEGLARAGRKDRMELKSYRFHRRVREGYLTLARSEPERIFLIRAHGSIREIQDRVRGIVLNVI